MILLDTNVMSKVLCHTHAPRVIEWIDVQSRDTSFLFAIAVADLRIGVAPLPAGKRRSGLQDNLEKRVLPFFVGRVLPFDFVCAQAHALLIAKARSTCLASATEVGYIAAIAAAGGLAVATRDTNPLGLAGVTVIHPWAQR